ncbi:MAG: GHKL domain-containing protein, partial [Clostridia bacterium]|nr:GHKL domain-containing protein [Clostridia bacterium]
TFFRLFAEIISVSTRNLAIISCCGVSGATAIVLYLYERTMRQEYQISKNQLSELKLKEQVKHYNDIMMTQGQVKKVKHDLKNHLFAIRSIVERKEYEECMEYIDSLLKDVNLSNAYFDTGNVVLDAILGAKKTEAERLGITFTSNIRIPSKLPLSQEDECVIFGNALYNAIEAAVKAEGEKYVNVSLVYDKETLMCKISNSAKDNSSATTKGDIKNHGLGRENINKALEKYNSVSRVTYENNEYTLFFIIMGLDLSEKA